MEKQIDTGKNHSELLAGLQEIYSTDPDNLPNALHLAQLYTDLSWYNQALEIYDSMLKKTPADYSIQLAYANLFYAKKDTARAVELLRRIVAIKPDRIEGWNNLGIVLFDSGNREEAAACFKHVLEVEPNNCGAMLNLGNCHDAAGETDKALAVFKQVVAERPDFADGWYNIGNMLVKMRRFDEAERSFERAIRIRPEFASALKNLGYVCEQQDFLDKAESSYRKALELNRTDASIYVNLSSVAIKRGQLDAARESLGNAVKLSPRDANAWISLRDLSLHMGDISTFVKSTLAIVTRLDPAGLAASIRLLIRLGLDEKAEALVKAAGDRGMEHIEIDAEKMRLSLRKNDKVSARLAYRKLSGLAVKSDAVLSAMSEYSVIGGSWEIALSHIAQIADPTSYDERLAWDALIGQRNMSAARTKIENCLCDDPDNSYAWFCLARIAVASFDEAYACECLARSLDAGFTEWEKLEANPDLKAAAGKIIGNEMLRD